MADSPQKLENVSQTTLDSGYPRDGEECLSRSEIEFETPAEAAGTTGCFDGHQQPLSSQQDTEAVVMPPVSAAPATNSESKTAVESGAPELADTPNFSGKHAHTNPPEVKVNTLALEMEGASTSQMVRPMAQTTQSIKVPSVVTPDVQDAENQEENDTASSQHSCQQQHSPQNDTPDMIAVKKDLNYPC